MPLAGRQMLPREAARLMYEAGWTDAVNLAKMLATADAESNLYTEAYHHNDNGTTDWGYLQLNDQGKTGVELEEFKAMALDPVKATAYARKLFHERGFQPWVAYTSGAWKAVDQNGEATHLLRASRGVCNFLRERYGVPPL